ncbi:heterogeneous nuclear ribonucleoprotein A3-like [Impatiens glandulifera]|uniref:heterogeneous nuclear ribonucleoprotein A3-like n=1 Tax=Impatiens glandulifera TaxID=253017 RepID=UPI001FB184BF|nr:heterogeneous nuclear ribonucleoprotein A3-like [Impatiens glandulifera]
MGSKRSDNPNFGDGASPGKIFIGGLAKDATLDQFTGYFGKYGEITDSVIMKDRNTQRPRGFGFITYADPAVVDVVIAETHVINGKQVEIKRTIPKGAAEPKDIKTKKIFVGGLPPSVTEDELMDFFSKHGKVVEHEIIKDHVSQRSRGFGFVVFDSEEVVDSVLSGGNMIDMFGTQVEIKKAEPKKPSNPSGPAYGSFPKNRGHDDSFGAYGSSYGGFNNGGFGPAPYRSYGGGLGGRYGDYGGYDGAGGNFGGRYGDFGGNDYMGYRGEQSLAYAGRFGSYGGFGGGYGGSGSGIGSYGRGGGGGGGGVGGYGGYGSGSGAGFESGPGSGSGSGYGGPGGGGGGMYGGRAGYSGGSRYHPYSR